MTALSVAIDPAAIFDATGPFTKHEILKKAAQLAGEAYALSADLLLERLVEREQLGTTGFGGAVAIPHAKIPGANKCFGTVIRLESPIEYEAHDGRPVDFIFALFSPESGGAMHLKALAEISRLLRDVDMVSKLRGASSPDAVYALLTGQREQQAA